MIWQRPIDCTGRRDDSVPLAAFGLATRHIAVELADAAGRIAVIVSDLVSQRDGIH